MSSSSSSSNSTVKVESFLSLFCQFIDLPQNGRDCSIEDPAICVQCKIRGAYFTFEKINDLHSYALMYYIFLWIVTVFLSVLAIFANILIIKVMRKNTTSEKQPGSFQLLLVVLAYLDAICSVMSIISSTGFTSYSADWFGRGQGLFYWCAISFYTAFFFRSVSTYITVLISIKGYLLITFPVKANTWFTQNKTAILISVMTFLGILTSYPRFVSWTVEPNPYPDVQSIHDLEYIIRSTKQGLFFYLTLGNWHNKLDFWVPLPLLLLFNVLSFLKVHELSKRRKEMNVKTKHEIRAVRMFLPVVIAYFITNIVPIAHMITIVFYGYTYRELYVLTFLSVAINSGVNLPIYYYRNRAFKNEVQNEIQALLDMFRVKTDKGMCARYDPETKVVSLESDSRYD